MVARLPVALLIVVAVVFAGLASVATATPRARHSVDLWATINVCDTTAHPATIGVRASMPGTGRRAQRMFMRIGIQYFSRVDSQWHAPATGGDSGFLALGSAGVGSRQTGVSFTVGPPTAGDSFVTRGVVQFQWRTGPRVVRRVTRTTSHGHPATEGSDPAGFSAGLCELRR